MMMMKTQILCMIVLLTFAIFTETNHAQTEDYAAVLEVIYEDVHIQRQNTLEWIPMRTGATMPIGVGDSIRTNTQGRAFIRFDDVLTILVMPSTQLTIETLHLTPQGQLSITLTSDGLILHQIHDDSQIAEYHLRVDDTLSIHQPAQTFATWLAPNANSYILVETGTLSLNDAGQTVSIDAGQGYGTDYPEVITLEGRPLNNTALIAQVDGCIARVNTTENRNLTVRNAPTLNSQIVGFIPNRSQIELVGVSADEQRFRARYYNSLGWVEQLGVDSTCTELPIYPLDTIEFYREMVNITDEEYIFTLPFFGQLSDDPLLYRFLENAPDGE
jgi:hypothetical protein